MARMKALGVGFALTLVTASCGFNTARLETKSTGGAGKVVSSSVLASASAKTAKLTTGQFRVTMATTGMLNMTIAINGAFDRAHNAVSMSYDMGDLLKSMGGSSSSASAALNGMGQIHAVMIGQTMYMQLPAAALGRMFPGKSWIKEDVGSKLGGSLGMQDLESPDAIMSLLHGASDQVVTVGTEELRGVATTHYHATFDASKALQRVPAAQRTALRQMLNSEPSLKSTLSAVPLDVWVDKDGILRKEQIGLSISAMGTNEQTTETFEIISVGGAVSISAPPASQVVDAKVWQAAMDKSMNSYTDSNSDQMSS